LLRHGAQQGPATMRKFKHPSGDRPQSDTEDTGSVLYKLNVDTSQSLPRVSEGATELQNERECSGLHTLPQCLRALPQWGSDVHVATRQGDTAMVKKLLESFAQVDTQGENGMQPIHFAARQGNCQMIAFLLDCNAQAGSKDLDGAQPLHFAAQSGSHDAVSMLLKHKADVNALDEPPSGKLQTQPLEWAVASGHPCIVKFLINHCAHVDPREMHRLADWCAEFGDRSCHNILRHQARCATESLQHEHEYFLTSGLPFQGN